MAITISFKTKASVGSDPVALNKLGLCKAFGVIFPLSQGGDVENEALLAMHWGALA